MSGMRDVGVELRHQVSSGSVLSKAALNASQRLDISSAVLARVLGLSAPTITRMRQGSFVLERNDKAFELAALFVRLYRSLDAIVGGDDRVAAQWLRSQNAALQDKPVNLIQKVTGLLDVLQYLDARRALS